VSSPRVRCGFFAQLRALWGSRPSERIDQLDPHHAASVSRILAAARFVVVTMAFIAVALDPDVDGIVLVLLGAGTVYSALVLYLAHPFPLGVLRLGLLLHVVDLAWIVAITTFTGGALSWFAMFYSFPLLSAAFRWRLRATILTALVAMAVILVQVYLGTHDGTGAHIQEYVIALRLLWIAVGAILVGLLAEREWQQRLRSLAVSRVLSRISVEVGFVASVRAVLADILEHLDASRAVLTLIEDGSSRAIVWSAEPSGEDGGPQIRVRQQEDRIDSETWWMASLPPEVNAVWAAKPGPGSPEWRVLALDADGLAAVGASIDLSPVTRAPFDWSNVYAIAEIAGQGWNGRLFVFDVARWGRSRTRLRYLQEVIRQVGPALFNLYLQRRLESRAGQMERGNISRTLHDGPLQSMIGLEMELEVLRRDFGPVMPAAAVDRLSELQGVLNKEALDLRDVIQRIKPRELDPERMLQHLSQLVLEFRTRTAIDARFDCALPDLPLPQRACGEVSAIVQEALVNVRKHSGASAVTVRVTATDAAWLVEVEDNGRGMSFDDLLREPEIGHHPGVPQIIRERVKKIGASLAIESRHGQGTRLEVAIPR
jgi:signal transduction histidine kinase